MTTKKIQGLDFWKTVDKTDPANTKKIPGGAKLTAVNAHSQIKAATEAWGPAGDRWYWNIDDEIKGELFIVRINLFTPLGDNPVIQYGSCPLARGGKPDHDAPKKAVTDALTKCLSYLGFNADVFLGQFDDNKYIDQRTKEVEDEHQHGRALDIKRMLMELHGDGAAGVLESALKALKIERLELLPAGKGDLWIKKLRANLKTRSDADNMMDNTEVTE